MEGGNHTHTHKQILSVCVSNRSALVVLVLFVQRTKCLNKPNRYATNSLCERRKKRGGWGGCWQQSWVRETFISRQNKTKYVINKERACARVCLGVFKETPASCVKRPTTWQQLQLAGELSVESFERATCNQQHV